MESIVKRFFTKETVKASVNLTDIKRIKNKIQANDERKFSASIELGEKAKQAGDFFDSKDCKAIMANMGLEMKKEDFFLASFGLKKSWLYKAIKAFEIGEEGIELYRVTAKAYQAETGTRKSVSIAGLLQFQKHIKDGLEPMVAIHPPKNEGNAGENEGNSGEGEGTDSTCTHTFVDKLNGVNFRIDNGALVSTNSKDEILASLTELLAKVSEM